jgi:putative spermidine/putrescine transport system ATP-binding protein
MAQSQLSENQVALVSHASSTGFAPTGAEVRLVGLSRYYGEVAAVRAVDLTIAAGEFLTLLGPSGSGKTTTLMMLAGFVQPTEGDIWIGGRAVVGLPPERRNIGMVFQNYALFPHMSVFDNVAFPLRMRGIDRRTQQARVQEALDLVQLGAMGKRKIQQLSGGQQQRVALARALVFRPPLLLMDEPLGALDRKLRDQMQFEIKRIQQTLGLTVVYVTHDQEEALALSDRIAIMNEGTIHQVGTPSQIYEHPATVFVAEFVGESNFLDGVVEALTTEGSTILISRAQVRLYGPTAMVRPGQAVQLMIRPEALRLCEDAGDLPRNESNAIRCVVEEVVYLGQTIRYTVRVDGFSLMVRAPHRPADPIFALGVPVMVTWPRATTLILPS